MNSEKILITERRLMALAWYQKTIKRLIGKGYTNGIHLENPKYLGRFTEDVQDDACQKGDAYVR